MICTSDLEKLQKRSAGQFNIVHLTTILKIYRNDDLPPGIHAKNSLNSPYLLMSSPFFTVDGLHLPWSSTGLNDDLRPRHISREAVFIQQCLSPWFCFTWFHVQGLQQHSSLFLYRIPATVRVGHTARVPKGKDDSYRLPGRSKDIPKFPLFYFYHFVSIHLLFLNILSQVYIWGWI